MFGPFPFLGRIVHIPTTEFGKLHFTWCIACVRLILTLLGASNCKRLGKVSQNCIYASISGATLENIDETIKLAKSKVFDKTITKFQHHLLLDLFTRAIILH
jgi:hypothetical protein